MDFLEKMGFRGQREVKIGLEEQRRDLVNKLWRTAVSKEKSKLGIPAGDALTSAASRKLKEEVLPEIKAIVSKLDKAKLTKLEKEENEEKDESSEGVNYNELLLQVMSRVQRELSSAHGGGKDKTAYEEQVYEIPDQDSKVRLENGQPAL
jgi:hypothetical protein